MSAFIGIFNVMSAVDMPNGDGNAEPIGGPAFAPLMAPFTAPFQNRGACVMSRRSLGASRGLIAGLLLAVASHASAGGTRGRFGG
jgi:hypothetical protein